MNSAESISKTLNGGKIITLLDQYLFKCHSDPNQSEEPDTRKKARKEAVFPNLAGFCRFLGVGVDAYEAEMAAYPEAAGVIRAVLEDEALNSDMAATLLSAYLKKRLGYDTPSEPKHAATDTGELKIVFEHDIFADGE